MAVSIQPFGQYLDSTLCTQTTCGLQAQLLAHGKLSVHVLTGLQVGRVARRSMTGACARRSVTGTRAAPLTSGEPGATYRRNGASKPSTCALLREAEQGRMPWCATPLVAPSLPPRAISAVCSFLGPMALHLPAPAHTPYHNPTTRQCTLEFLCQMSRRRATCYLKSIPPATDSKSCAGSPTRASCDDAVKLSASLAIAHAKKMVMTGDRWGGRGASGTRRDDQLTPVEERLTS